MLQAAGRYSLRMAADDVFATLNEAQQQVLRHDAARPLLVIAGAGSGKTGTLAARVARLVLDGADPQRIALLTFSRRAAAAMNARVGHWLRDALPLPPGSAPMLLPWAGTFHSVGARLVRRHAAHIGLASGFTLLDAADAEELMGLVRQQLGLHRSEQRFPLAGSCLALLSRVTNGCGTVRALVEAEMPWCDGHVDELQALFKAYTAEKQRQQLLDFDDLLLYWHWMATDAQLGPALRGLFDHLLVDEMQDTNALQQAIVLAMAPAGRGLVAVGDDAQSIYAFRGAALRGMLEFPRRFEPPAAVVALEQNYRSTPQILAAANAVIALAAEGFRKHLFTTRRDAAPARLVHVLDEAAEARWVAEEVLAQREQGLALKRQAVLFRSSSHSALLELELARRRIPFLKYGGLRFLEAAHVKDLLSLLRWVQNPRAELAGLRVARLVPGIGPAAARTLVQAMGAVDDPRAALQAFEPPARAAAEWAALQRCVQRLLAAPWPEAIGEAIDWYLPHLQRLHDDARARAADLEQLRAMAAGHGSRERFLAELTIDPPQASSEDARDPSRDEDYLILSTIHSAKGQEWNAVSVLKVVDGCIPSDMATGSIAEIEEERRLLYVAMTRAKDQLNMLVPQRFHVTQQRHQGDRHLYASRTRFLPDALLPLFDVESPAAPADPEPSLAGGNVDLAARALRRFDE